MINQFHAIYEREGEWFVAFCPEIPEANGMGKTKAKCIENLIDAIRFILQDRYEDSIHGLTENSRFA
jgi:predicted RNase H-like HicB family nuclease